VIVRIWRAWATADGAQGYRAHFEGHVLPALEALEGFLGAELLVRHDGAEVALMTQARFATLAHVSAFAGDDLERAVVHPEAAAHLSRFEQRVHHFEVVAPR
jgi:heme-degrading monooxygenase HmoA